MKEEKQYAKELTEKMLRKIIELAYAETKSMELAKQCALICLDEMIDSHIGWATEQDECVYFYIEVKKELQKI